MATLSLTPKTIVRFAPGSPDARTAVVLKDGSFLQVKPTKQKFANGDAWSISFMGAEATLVRGIDAGKLLISHPPSVSTPPPPQKDVAFLNIQNENGDTALHRLMDFNAPPNIQNNQEHLIARRLLATGADPNIRNNKGETPLYLALKSHANNTIRCLLEFGADLNIQMPNGDYLLHVAANAGGMWYLHTLLEFGVNPNVQARDGRTPLHQMVQKGATTLAKMLLDAGADKTIRDAHGNTALHYATAMKDKEAVRLLLRS